MLKFYPKMSQMSTEARTALEAQQQDERHKELAASREAQRAKHERHRVAEAAAMRAKLMRRGPGRPRMSSSLTISQAIVNITNLNVGSGTQMNNEGQPSQSPQPADSPSSLSSPLSSSPSWTSSACSSSSPSLSTSSSSSWVPA
jgi:hypothetical protein